MGVHLTLCGELQCWPAPGMHDNLQSVKWYMGILQSIEQQGLLFFFLDACVSSRIFSLYSWAMTVWATPHPCLLSIPLSLQTLQSHSELAHPKGNLGRVSRRPRYNLHGPAVNQVYNTTDENSVPDLAIASQWKLMCFGGGAKRLPCLWPRSAFNPSLVSSQCTYSSRPWCESLLSLWFACGLIY